MCEYIGVTAGMTTVQKTGSEGLDLEVRRCRPILALARGSDAGAAGAVMVREGVAPKLTLVKPKGTKLPDHVLLTPAMRRVA